MTMLDFLALPLQDVGQGQHGAQAVAVGADVGGQQETLVAVNEIDERRPIERHDEPF